VSKIKGGLRMAIQSWKTFLLPYEQAVEELKVKLKSLRKEYRKRNEYSPIEFVTGRVKEVSSLLEKANKFGIPLDRVAQEMEDIAGIRIMCQFVDDIDKVVELLRARKDMQILYEKDYVRNVKASGYRSYHVIIKYLVNMADGPKEILAEFQIRTLAMNFWATTEHSLNYKYKQHIPDEIKVKLKRAAELSAPETNVIEASGHTGGSTDVGDVQHLMPVYTFNTGGVKGGLHQVEFEVTDEEEAYIVTAKMFALGAYGLLKEKAARSRELVKNYKPVFENSAKYAEFMDQFDSKEVLE
jgi:ppGpp synthetase/RelA/SpoT-type nucleotidyltranferase